MRLAAPLCALLLFLSAAPADAATTPPDPITRAVSVAERAWPGSPCNGRISVDWAPGLTAPGVGPVDGLATGAPIDMGGDASCSMRLDARLLRLPIRLCDVIVHEAGHLAGRRHDPASPIMRGDGGASWPACWATPTRRHRRG